MEQENVDQRRRQQHQSKRHDKAGLKQGETILVSAGEGGVAVAAIQLAKVAGARVITTIGSKEEAERTMELGADLAIN